MTTEEGIWICKYCKRDKYKGKHSLGFSLCKCDVCGKERHCVYVLSEVMGK